MWSVFSDTGLHLILRGSVVQETKAFSPTSDGYSCEVSSSTPITEETQLQVTEKVDSIEHYNVLTTGPGCLKAD